MKATIIQARISISPTYCSDGTSSGQYAVIIDVGDTRYHYQPKGMVSYDKSQAKFFATDLHNLFAAAVDPMKVIKYSSYFKRVA